MTGKNFKLADITQFFDSLKSKDEVDKIKTENRRAEISHKVDEQLHALQLNGYDINKINFRVKNREDIADIVYPYILWTSQLLKEEFEENPNFIEEKGCKYAYDLAKDRFYDVVKEETEKIEELRDLSKKLSEGGKDIIFQDVFMKDAEKLFNKSEIPLALIDVYSALTGEIYEDLFQKGYIRFHGHKPDLKVLLRHDTSNFFKWYEIYSPNISDEDKYEMYNAIKNTISKVGKILEDNSDVT